MKVFLAMLSFLFLLATTAQAQEDVSIEKDTLILEKEDTILMKSYAARFNPRKALLYSAAVPGLGQVYNKKYWKVPLIYGGAFAIGFNINTLNGFYKTRKAELFRNIQSGKIGDTDVFDPQNPNELTTGQLRSQVTRYRRDRDFWVIMMGVLYILQVVDAHVDAHLKEFDLNPNLRVDVNPMMENNSLLGRQTGVSLVMKF